MSFFECEFPKKIAFTASGSNWGPTWSTIVNAGFSGFEQRNRNWAFTRNKYALDLVARPLAEYQSLLNFFLSVSGKSDAFRFLDDVDFLVTAVTPCSPAAGDGANKVFQLQKNYTVGSGAAARTYTRTVSKPIMSHQSATITGGAPNYNASAPVTDFQGITLLDTVLMYLNNVNNPGANNYTIDATTGLVTFAAAPGMGVAVGATFQHHIPVRFDSDDWPARIEPSNVPSGAALVNVTGIMLVEVRILAGASQG